MRRLPRNPEKYDVIDLFAAMARELGYELEDPASKDDFLNRIRESFERSKMSPVTVFGKRVEALFAYVVGALGAASILKQEDSGDVYFSGDEVAPPDYRLTLKNGKQFLVEVKNCNGTQLKSKFSIRRKDLIKMLRYSELNSVDFKLAIYFSAWNRWTLLSSSALEEGKNAYTIDFASAFAKSEMATIGDCMVATTPDLEIIFETDMNEAHKVEFGSAMFVIRKITILCAGREVTNDLEKNLAFYFMRFGEWVESGNEAIIQEGKLIGIRLTYSPESPTEHQDFQILGILSSMVSDGFREITVKEGKVVAITSKSDPSAFSIFIPEKYRGDKLPLWRFSLQPNASFTH